MNLLLIIIWQIASVLILYMGLTYSFKYHFKKLNIIKIITAIKSKSNNKITPIASLCTSLAAKIGVGSLSGIAIALYFGGVGTIFWIMLISLIISINTYLECKLGMKYREKINNNYLGGPSYYIKKCLNNKYLSYLYSLLIIISYSFIFLSIQTNTIVNTIKYYNFKSEYIIFFIVLLTFIIIRKGIDHISFISKIIVPIMLLFYCLLGIYIFITNISDIPLIIKHVITEAFSVKSILMTFLIGMQRAIFITESSLGTSAIMASTCDNDSEKQAMLEVLGIYITIFIVALTTFLIIVTSNYQTFKLVTGIDLLLYAFNYHFGKYGAIFLSVITILFAFSTIISSYYLGESNLLFITKNKRIKLILEILFILVIIVSPCLKTLFLWHLVDYFLALLAIINVYAILKILKRYKSS